MLFNKAILSIYLMFAHAQKKSCVDCSGLISKSLIISHSCVDQSNQDKPQLRLIISHYVFTCVGWVHDKVYWRLNNQKLRSANSFPSSKKFDFVSENMENINKLTIWIASHRSKPQSKSYTYQFIGHLNVILKACWPGNLSTGIDMGTDRSGSHCVVKIEE